MKRIIILILAAFIVFLGIFLLGDSETQLVDVRTVEEYSAGHADGAINVPLADIQSGDFSKIKKDAYIKLYCRSGNRAEQAKVLLEKKGYNQVVNIGGIDNWQDKGGKVCKSTEPTC